MNRSIRELSFAPVKSVFRSPEDWRDQIIYHLMIDRFDNNDLTLELAHERDCGSSDQRGNGLEFKGGKIAGITRRLDYIKKLGCSTLWISPPFKNRKNCPESYHGYAVQNFLEVDPRFGTLADLQELVREAHKRHMYVIFDVVINHTGDNWEYASGPDTKYTEGKRHRFGGWRNANGRPIEGSEQLGSDDGVWPFELQSADCYHRKGTIVDFEDPDQVRNGDIASLKDLDHDCNKIMPALIACYKWWIAQTDCDGFRIDAVKHCEPKATANFANAIREYAMSIGKKNFLILAEIIEEDEELIKYIGMNIPVADDPCEEYPLLSACLDFPLYFDLEDVIKRRKPWRLLKERYERAQHYFRDYSSAGKYFVTFLENHDQVKRGYYRFMHGATDPRLAILGHGYLITAMGMPCIYYGSEQGLNGGSDKGDHFVRETMFGSDWGGLGIRKGHLFDEDNNIYTTLATLCEFRSKSAALRYGRQYFMDVSPEIETLGRTDTQGMFAFTRVLDSTSILVVFNLETERTKNFVRLVPTFHSDTQSLTDAVTGQRLKITQINDGQTVVQIEMKPRSLAVFITQAP